MKNSILLLAFILFGISMNAQLTFGPLNQVTSTADGAVDVVLADIDGDLDLDIVGCDTFGGVDWYENLGGGVFGPANPISDPNDDTSNSIEVVDIDEDGDNDVFLMRDELPGTSDNDIVWFQNDGTGTFTTEIQIAITNGYNGEDVVAVDMDDDGDQDILFCEASADQIAWVEHFGGGIFGSVQTVNNFSTNGPSDVDAADFDGDGDMDVVCVGEYEDNVSWYENTGSGFGTQQIIGTGDGGASVEVGDFDGDSDTDVVVSYFIDSKVVVHLNDGSGNFDAGTDLVGPLNIAFGLEVWDLDLDGDLDVLATALNGDKVCWYENDGTGTFSSQNIITTAADRPFGIAVGDIDGDGDNDVASANYNADEIAWYENTTVVSQVDGCTDPDACNYNPDATNDDGSCDFVDAFILTWEGPTTFCSGDGESDLFSPGVINVGNSGQNSAFVLTDENGIIQYAGGSFFTEFEGTAPGVCYAYSVNYQDGTTGLVDGENLADVEGCFDVSDPIIITKLLAGCMNVLACNFDPNAECDFGCDFGGCTDPVACNYNPDSTCDDGTCTYPGCFDPQACNYNVTAGCDDGSCIYPGCTDPIACNYDMNVGCDDGSCTYPGCTDNLACNFDVNAGCDGGNCEYPCPGYDCGGDCIDADNDGNCDFSQGGDDIAGCTDPDALNYYSVFTIDDGSCIYAQEAYCGEGTAWDPDSQTCVSTYEDPCPSDINEDGVINTNDLLLFLAVFGQICQ